MHPENLKYSPDHLWLKEEACGQVRLGLTYHYQDKIKSVVFLDLPRVGTRVAHGEPFGVIESSKISTDLISPVTGIVTEANTAVLDKPGLVNKDPYGQGWLIVVRLDDPAALQSLLSSAQYLAAAASETAGS